VLLVADSGLTVASQEPVSAVIAAGSQSAGETARPGVRDTLQRLAAPLAERVLRIVAARYRRRLRTGGAVARIEPPTLDRGYAMVEGTDPASRHFRAIDRPKAGDAIHVTLPSGCFTEEAARSRLVRRGGETSSSAWASPGRQAGTAGQCPHDAA
jgi:hypothetical protein